MDKCYTQASMEEEDTVAAGEANTAKADKTKSATPTNGKRTDAVLGSLVQGGVILPDPVTAKTQLNAGIAENPATMKKNAERRSMRQVDNSQSVKQVVG